MNLRTKITVGVCVLLLGGLVVIGLPALTAIGQGASATSEGIGGFGKTVPPSPDRTRSGVGFRADRPGQCTTPAVVGIVNQTPTVQGTVLDLGAREGARGEVVSDADGIRAYIVAPNDNLITIGERLCVSYPPLATFNHVLGDAIQPGQQLILRPDPTIPWIDPYVPFGAQPGRNTVSYNTAIYEMGRVVRARDIDAARSVWGRLAPDVSPGAGAVTAKALDEVDWRVLGQLFP